MTAGPIPSDPIEGLAALEARRYLRHQYASRLVERKVPLAQVRDLLGHASIITTERYDNQKLENLQAAALSRVHRRPEYKAD